MNVLCVVSPPDFSQLGPALGKIVDSLPLESQLDLALVDCIDEAHVLDDILGNLYCEVREVLLEKSRYDVETTVLFNDHYAERRWDSVYYTSETVWDRFKFKGTQKGCRLELQAGEPKFQRECEPEDDHAPEGIHRVCAVGGTFDHIHDGHKILLSMAAYLTSDELIVGVTDQELLRNKKYAEVLQSYNERCNNVIRFIARVKPQLQVKPIAIRDVCGPTGTVPGIQGLVVSRETVGGGEFVNKTRVEKGMLPLEIHVVNVIGGSENDGWKDKLSSTELRKRELESRK